MPTAKLPQPYGLRIELIRAGGLTDLEALKVLQEGDKETLVSRVSGEISWDGFLEYAKEEWLTVKTAIANGYRYKFLTIGGLKDLLSIRFGREAERDYTFDGGVVEGLRLAPEEYEALRGYLAVNWSLTVTAPAGENGRVEVRLKHTQPEEQGNPPGFLA
jgi:hypothetical protein